MNGVVFLNSENRCTAAFPNCWTEIEICVAHGQNCKEMRLELMS